MSRIIKLVRGTMKLPEMLISREVFLQTEVLKQLSSMGRLIVNAGDGVVKSATNL